VNLYLAGLVLFDVAALRRGSRLAGVGTGLATAVKLTPGLFVLYLALTGRWRAAGTAAGACLGAAALAFCLAPGTSVQFWTRLVFQTSRVGPTSAVANQSVLGLLTRVSGPDRPGTMVLWAAVAAVVLAVGLARARSAHRRGDDLVGSTLTGLTACLVSPISWTHHLFWIVPAEVVLVDLAAGTAALLRRRPRPVRAAAAAAAVVVFLVFALSVVWYFAVPTGGMRGQGLAAVLGADAYVLLMLGLLLLLPARRTATAIVPGPSHPAGRSVGMSGESSDVGRDQE
jgi:alpha-1,2-mannosyltransferase